VIEESADRNVGRGDEADQPAWGMWLVFNILRIHGRSITI